MLKNNVVQRFFSIFFCFFIKNCDIRIPKNQKPTYYEKYKTYCFARIITCNGEQNIFLALKQLIGY